MRAICDRLNLSKPMKLLLTNDDGIDAPGLAALEAVLRELGEVVVVAPHTHLSGCSHQANTARPLHVEQTGPSRYSVDGTPVDCTRIGLQHLMPDADWVLAGINDGGNLGADIHLSGTVAAVREAALLGRPGIALSHYRRPGATIDWPWGGRRAVEVLEKLWPRRCASGTFWNVNLPHAPARDARPEVVFCPLDLNPLPVHFELEAGRYHYRASYHDRPRTRGADVDVCFSGNIAVTQLFVAHHPQQVGPADD